MTQQPAHVCHAVAVIQLATLAELCICNHHPVLSCDAHIMLSKLFKQNLNTTAGLVLLAAVAEREAFSPLQRHYIPVSSRAI